MSGGPLIVLQEGFGRAAEKLVDTIRHVVDVAVSPNRTRAMAQAQADAEVILAKGRAEVQDIQARADERVRKREARRQHNLESITQKALEALPPPEQLSEEPVNEDWTSRFFEECQDISDEQMQQIWARILAGEVARPGSFAPRTLSVARDLTKDDANLFAKVCEFVWFIPEVGFVPVIQELDAPHLVTAGINFARLTHLSAIGLIEFGLMAYGLMQPIKQISPSYCDAVHHLKSDGGHERRFEFGRTIFTAVGAELHRISGAQGNDEHQKAALQHWGREGWKEAGEATAAS